MGLVDLTGKRFSRWFVKGLTAGCGKVKYWDCVCDCGSEKSVFGGDLKRGGSRSCGCLAAEVVGQHTVTHGMSYHPAYRNWMHAKVRCENPESEAYKDYGGRGIRVCERWGSFSTFWDDMGATWIKGRTLDRIDVDGNYEPGNCRWATAKMQANNRRNNVVVDTPRGRMTISEASQAFGVVRSTLVKRIASGAEPDRWFDPPLR